MNTKQEKVLNNLFKKWEKDDFWNDYYPGVSEPGYEDSIMVTADWNRVSDKFYNWLTDYFKDEIQFDWSDEYVSCSDCNKAVRSISNCHSWQQSYLWASDCEIVCLECWESAQDDIIQFYKVKNDHAVSSEFIPYLEKAGFKCFEKDNFCELFVTGFHPGQNADPKEVAKFIENNLPKFEYIFAIQSVGQFDCHWSVFIRKEEMEE